MRTPRLLVADRNEDAGRAAQARSPPTFSPRPRSTRAPGSAPSATCSTEDGPFDVLVSGPSLSTRSGLARLELIRDELPGLTMMLAFTRRPDAAMRDIIRTGAIDLVQLPAADEDLRDALARALEISAKRGPAMSPAPSRAGAHGGPRQPGVVFTMSSATGGCGKTFLATNLAYLLSHYTGQAGVHRRPRPAVRRGVDRAAPAAPLHDLRRARAGRHRRRRRSQAHIEDYMVTHESGFSVLAAPRDPAEADRIDPPDVTRIIEAVRARFDYVVVDTPAALTEVVLAAFDLSDVLYTMATLDLPSVRNMGVFLGTLEKLKISNDNIRLILNKAERDVGINVEQVTKLFPQGFKAVLPYAREVSRSINLGMPVRGGHARRPRSAG